MAVGPWQILLVLALVLLLFGGRGKISSIMGDMGRGISSFKKGIKDGADEAADAVDSAIDVTPKAVHETPKTTKKP